MIWLFKVNEVFWNDTPKINDYYTFETDDIDFDITKYDVSLYFAKSNYYILNDSNDEEIYSLRLIYSSGNPMRVLLSDSFDQGKTWSSLRSVEIPDEIGPPSLTNPIMKLPDGKLLMSIENNKKYHDKSTWKQKAVFLSSWYNLVSLVYSTNT